MNNISHVVVSETPEKHFSCTAHTRSGEATRMCSSAGHVLSFRQVASAARFAVRRFGKEVPIYLEMESVNHD